MTTAEKRAALEAEGQSWPDCECHGEPLLWQRDPKLADGGKFYCRVANQERRNKWRAQRRDAGLCVDCGDEAEVRRCRPCADRHADSMATPKQRMLHQFAQIRYRNRQKDFRPTGVGITAFAEWVKASSTGEAETGALPREG